MNLKNNYLLKKLLKWNNKNCKNFNIYIVAFFKNMDFSFVILDQFCHFTLISAKADRIFCHFGPLLASQPPHSPPPNNPENQHLKKAWRYYPFTHVYHKWRSYDVWFLRYGAWQTEIFVIWAIFFLFTSLTTRNIKILKNKQKKPKTSADFVQCRKSAWSYAILFLRYGVWRM